MDFVHLHLHTQYSILDGLTGIKPLFKRARELGMSAVAITDHGNMYGVKEFLKYAFDKKSGNLGSDGNPIVKPIIGCEVYVTTHYDHKLKDSDHKSYNHLILLAKNYEGYRNLMKIVSLGHVEGMYYKPRVDHQILERYHDNLICSSACLAGEIARDIVRGDEDAARTAIAWYRRVFGDDYYLEVMLHRTEVPGVDPEIYSRQKKVCETVFRLAEETGVKVIATNDVHFLMKEDGPAHDRLICLTTNANLDDPDRLRYTQQEYFKSAEEMAAIFPDHPEALANTLEVASKVEVYKIDHAHILPKFDIDPKFLADIDAYLEKYSGVIDEGRTDKDGNPRGEDFCRSMAYMCHLTYEGAARRYGQTLTDEQSSRIDFELRTICKMGFPDYFLIVQDYIGASRRMGYMVGPGRGSAAGSVVAYCLGITNVDPLKYDLLFERFLNPDRISMPDIDIDFENLPAAHKYVEDKYGSSHVSRVITFGRMLAKGAIKDVARISKLSIDESVRLTKLIPEHLEDGVEVTLENCLKYAPELKAEFESGPEINREVLRYAAMLEGSIRQVGQHACATIIGRGDLKEYIPVCLSEDKETRQMVQTSQYDGHYIEDVGMLKMDFLGLNTLSIIHATLDNIKRRHGLDIDIEAIPVDDKPTYDLYGRGDTTIVFQFESEGMKKHLRRLHPERFEDIIAMNALYRPGPMDYIDDFIDRKLGLKPIEYDIPEMSKYLSGTYGITVYQEQVMLLSQQLAGFTKGQADTLRKAMGKKQIETLNSLKETFMSGGKERGHDEKVLDKIWKDWEKFAQYAFNKSHATCYAWVSYQTGWLKAHYPSEFFAANLSCNLDSMDEIKKILAECKMHGVSLLSPDINESVSKFSVNANGDIRFGLGGMKGFGSNIVDAIIGERDAHGPFADVYDFVERMAEQSALDPRTPSVSRKSLETLVYAGAFDSFGYDRQQFFRPCANGEMFIDNLQRYSDLYKADKMEGGASLFGDSLEMKPVRPEMPAPDSQADRFSLLQKEKEIVGMFISSHPLDRYSYEMSHFTNCQLVSITDLEKQCTETRTARKVNVAGIVVERSESVTRSGKPMLKVKMEDYSGQHEFALFGKDVDSYKSQLELHAEVYLEGEIRPKYFGRKEDSGESAPAEMEFKILGAMSLGNVCDKFVKELKCSVTTSMLTPEFKSSLVSVLRKYKGRTTLVVSLYDDASTHWTVDFKSNRFTVSVCTALIDEIRALSVIVD